MVRPTAAEDVFRAVADPTRRAVLQSLAQQGQLPVTRLAELVDVSLPVASRHLAVLRTAGLVTDRRSGRQRLYSLRPDPLHELYDWAALFAGFWAERVEGLRAYLDRHAGPTDAAGGREHRERTHDAT